MSIDPQPFVDPIRSAGEMLWPALKLVTPLPTGAASPPSVLMVFPVTGLGTAFLVGVPLRGVWRRSVGCVLTPLSHSTFRVFRCGQSEAHGAMGSVCLGWHTEDGGGLVVEQQQVEGSPASPGQAHCRVVLLRRVTEV